MERRTNDYGVLANGELANIWADVRQNGGDFAVLPFDITSYLLENFLPARSLCLLADTSMAFKKLIHNYRMLQKAFTREYPLLSQLFLELPHIPQIRSGRLAFRALNSPHLPPIPPIEGVDAELVRAVQALRTFTDPRVSESLSRFLTFHISQPLANYILSTDVLPQIINRSSRVRQERSSKYHLNDKEYLSVLANYVDLFSKLSEATTFPPLLHDERSLIGPALLIELVELQREFCLMDIGRLYQEALYAINGALYCFTLMDVPLGDRGDVSHRWKKLTAAALRSHGASINEDSATQKKILFDMFVGDVAQKDGLSFLSLLSPDFAVTTEELFLLNLIASLHRFPADLDIFSNVVAMIAQYSAHFSVWRTMFLAQSPNLLLDAFQKLNLHDRTELAKLNRCLSRASLVHVIFLNGSGMKSYLLTEENNRPAPYDDKVFAAIPLAQRVVEQNLEMLQRLLPEVLNIDAKTIAPNIFQQAVLFVLFSLLSYSNVSASFETQKRCLQLIDTSLEEFAKQLPVEAAEVRDHLLNIIRALIVERMKVKAPSQRTRYYQEYIHRAENA